MHLSFPSPLDVLTDQLGGPGNVAEMTGRKGRLVRVKGKGNHVHYEQRDRGGCSLESLNNKEVFSTFRSFAGLMWCGVFDI